MTNDWLTGLRHPLKTIRLHKKKRLFLANFPRLYRAARLASPASGEELAHLLFLSFTEDALRDLCDSRKLDAIRYEIDSSLAAEKQQIEAGSAVIEQQIQEANQRENRSSTSATPVHQYAFDELRTLVRKLASTSVENRTPTIRYICALVAELAYYHVPPREIDDRKRAKIIPCTTYQDIVADGLPTTTSAVFSRLDLVGSFFVVEEAEAVVVGFALDRFLFIGVRGTQFLFDWKINLRASLVPSIGWSRAASMRRAALHSGFAQESARIAHRITEALRGIRTAGIDHVFVAGHSLGGAVGAIAAEFIQVAPSTVIMFGAPRYATSWSDFHSRHPPIQVRRHGDLVPTVPPRILGYSDHANGFTTRGLEYTHRARVIDLGGLVPWIQFLLSGCQQHYMEEYRHELGETAGALGARLPLGPVTKLTRQDVTT